MVVEDLVFGAIEESARIEAAGRNEVPPVIRSVAQIEPAAAIAEAAVRSRHIAMRRLRTEAGTGGYHNHKARLAPVFRGRRAFDHFHRLHRIDRNLIGKNLALLVGNGLAVDRKRVRRVVAHPVKKAV